MLTLTSSIDTTPAARAQIPTYGQRDACLIARAHASSAACHLLGRRRYLPDNRVFPVLRVVCTPDSRCIHVLIYLPLRIIPCAPQPPTRRRGRGTEHGQRA